MTKVEKTECGPETWRWVNDEPKASIITRLEEYNDGQEWNKNDDLAVEAVAYMIKQESQIKDLKAQLLDKDVGALSKQVGGSHYTSMAIQPMEYSMANNFNACQHTAIKYISRYEHKNGVEDLKKAIHCIEMLIEHVESKK